jgi:hypothetical protein
MSDLLTTSEAAALWGCTERHIQWMAQHGRLPVAQVVNRMAGTTYRPARLYRPGDVLRARANSREGASESGRVAAKRNLSRERLRDHALRLTKVWHSLPRDERAKHSRRWMAHAAHVERTANLRPK